MSEPDSAFEHLSEVDWTLLTAVAAEGRLGASVLQALGGTGAQSRALQQQGWLAQAGQVRPLSLSQGSTEPAFESGGGTRQRVLRWAHEKGTLDDVIARLQALLGSRSVGAMARRLQAGALVLRREASKSDPALEAELRESVTAPFDPLWFQKTWGEKAGAVTTRVLEQALVQLSDCGKLYHWASTTSELPRDDEQLASVLAYHTLHRLERGESFVWLDGFDSATRLGLDAVAYFLEGNGELAKNQLGQSLSFSSGRLRAKHPWAPLLALLLTANDDAASQGALKTWLAARGVDAGTRSAARALRVFLRHQQEPSGEFKRINPHQVGRDISSWEELILGLTVYCFVTTEVTRHGWAERLGRSGVRWYRAGYLWMGRQALVLAQALQERPLCATALGDGAESVLPSATEGLDACPGDLCWLFAPRKEWEVGLAALRRVAQEEAPPETKSRIEWFVDPATGSVARPGRSSYQAGRGWSRARRISVAEIATELENLPSEDQRVLQALTDHCRAQKPDRDISEGPSGTKSERNRQQEPPCATEVVTLPEPGDEAFPHAEVLEALIGHRRVVSGAAGGSRVDVVSLPCQVETVDEAEGLRIRIAPKGLSAGLNILREGESRILVTRVDEAMAAVLMSLKEDLLIPHAHAPEAVSVLGELSEAVTVKSQHVGAELHQVASSMPCLRIAPVAGAWLVELGVRPFAGAGRFFGAGEGPAVVSALVDGRSLRTERDFDQERQRAAALRGACPLLARAPSPDASGLVSAPLLSFGGDEILQLLSQVSGSRLTCEFEWPQSPPMALRGQVSTSSLHGTLRSKKGWYLLSGSVDLDEVTHISLAELARLPSRMRGRFRLLPSGDFIEVERRVRHALAALTGAESVKGRAGVLQVGGTRLAALRKLLGDGEFELDGASRQALERLRASELSELSVPDALQATLRDYQVEGFRWLSRLAQLGMGACLADDMGLGKTLQILAFLLTRRPGQIHLVVAPTSVCTNWRREMERFAPGLVPVELAGPRRREVFEQALGAMREQGAVRGQGVREQSTERKSQLGTVFITSYALLHEDAQFLAAQDWDTVVLDEAQFIKNAKSLRAAAAYGLPAQMRIAASGTPVENHLGDLWSIFHFLNPDLLGSWPAFRTHFVKPVQRDDDHIARDHLRDLIRPYLLRRTKDQVLGELPPLTTVRKDIRLGDDDALRYAALRREIHTKLHTRAGKENNKLEILAEITRLRRFCCHPRLVFPDAPSECAKLDAFIDLAGELHENGHRALVFSQYVDFLELAKERVAEVGIAFESLDGSTPKAQRQARIDRFQKGEVPLFLISLKAGGFGLNLTAADYVIHLDPWWNPAVAAQATDRAHRIGQTRPVTVYEFVTRDTIEDDILKLHESKQRLSDLLLEGGQGVGAVSYQELLDWVAGEVEG